MNMITIILGIFFAIFFYWRFRDPLFPGFIFNIWWVLILAVSSINFLNLYEITESTKIILLLGLVCFNIPCLIYSLNNNNSLKLIQRNDLQFIEESVSFKKLAIIQIILGILMLPFVIKAINIISQYGLLVMRTEYTSNINLFMTTLERIFFVHFIVFPCASACFLISAILWASGKINFNGLIIGFINIAFISIITAGRMDIFNSFIYIILAYLLFGSKDKKISNALKRLSKKRKHRIILIGCIILAVGLYLTFQRSSQSTSQITVFLQTLTIYFTGGIQLLDIAISNPALFGLTELTFGSVYIAGFLSIFLMIIKYIPFLSININLPTSYAQQYITQSHSISPDISMNAFATMYYYFIRDFGILGVILLTIIFSIVCVVVYRYMKINQTILNSVLYVLSFSLIFYSIFWWKPYTMEFWTFLFHCIWIIPFIKYSFKIRIRG